MGLGAQAAINWWKIGANEALGAKHAAEISALKEWKAQAIEQIAQLRREVDRLASAAS